MSAANTKQLQEANALMKEAKGFLSRTLTRWSPDYDSAAVKFDKAAVIFRNLKMNKETYDALKEAANAHYKAGNLFFAGKACENAANIMRDEKKYSEAMADYDKAANVFLEDGKATKAAETLKNAARTIADKLEPNSPYNNKLIAIFKRSLEIYADNDDNHHSEEGFRAFNSFLVKQNMFAECIENMKEQQKAFEAVKQKHNIWKVVLSIVILYLAKDDWSAAYDYQTATLEKYASEYQKEEECTIANEFLQAFETNDPELLKKALSRGKIKFLENSIAQLCKRLKINPNLVGSKPNVVKSQRAAALDDKKKALFAGLDDEDEDDNEQQQYSKDDDHDEPEDPKKNDLKKQPTGKDSAHDDDDPDPFDPNSLV